MTRFLSLLLIAIIVVSGAYAQTPPTPTDLRVQPLPNLTVGALLTWRAPAGSQQYRIYRSANDTSHFAAIGTSTPTTWADTTIVRGTRYYYFVKSFIGTVESGRSTIVNILLPIPLPLPTPRNLTATLQLQSFEPTVKLNWSAPRGPWRFILYRSTNDTLHYRSFASVQDTLFFDHGVRAESTYFYYVRSASTMDTTVSPRSNVASIRVTMPRRPKGIVRGVVIDDSTNAPIRHVLMTLYRQAAYCGMVSAYTDSLGRYAVSVDTGRYIMRAVAMSERNLPPYRAEYYNNCYEPRCATVITVRDSQTFTANMGLARLVPPSFAYINGVVKDTANRPLRSARVSIIRTMQEMNFIASLGLTPGVGDEAMELDGVGHTRGVVWSGYTDSLGRYRAHVIANARYIAMASKDGFIPEYFNNKPTAELADIIVLGSRDTSGIDFSLAVRPIPNNSISGIVRDSLGTRVPSRVTLMPTRNAGRFIYAHTDSLGAYRIAGVEAGKYFVLASPFSGYGFAFYKAGAYGVTRIQDADTVNITGNVANIDIGVRRIRSNGLTTVNGRIRAANSSAIAGVRVTVSDPSGEVLGIGVTDGTGAYTLDAVAPGTVTIVADRNGYNSSEVTALVPENLFLLDYVNLSMTPNGVTSVGGNGVVPLSFALNQNYPNPFNPSTSISFELPAASRVRLQVFNVLGQLVASLVNGEVAAGKQQIVWNARDDASRGVASGIYLYRLQATPLAGGQEFNTIRKMVLLK